MSAFLYGAALQWKLDIRSKSLLITCYAVPLLFFAIMGGIFTSVNPESKYTLIQSMTVMGVSMGALIGLPPSLVEIYASDIKNVYKANGVPLYLGLISMFFSAFIHLLMMCAIICIVAPVAFDAVLPPNLPLYFGSLAVFIAVSLSIGSVLGLSMKNQAKLTMISQIVFLPSMMLSGIMFPVNLLPQSLSSLGKIFPAAWGNLTMTSETFKPSLFIPLLVMFFAAITACGYALSKKSKE
ncbi:MAG: ABC transporter permease [Lachnospiraceae bacterium]